MRESQECANCLFWSGYKRPAVGDGVCRRHPPSMPSSAAVTVDGVWPATRSDAWCGEWRADQHPASRAAQPPSALDDDA